MTDKINVRFPIPYCQTYTKEQIKAMINLLQAAYDDKLKADVTIFDENGNASDYKLYHEITREKPFPDMLSDLLNRNSLDAEANTPDFILAEYLNRCLENFTKTNNARENWHGRNPMEYKTEKVVQTPSYE